MIMGTPDQPLHPRPAIAATAAASTSAPSARSCGGWCPLWVRRLPPAEWLTFRAMSILEPSDKMKMHQSYPVINLNLALIAPLVAPHLTVIDAFEAMEGNGPTEGTPVPLRLALASHRRPGCRRGRRGA